MMKKIYSLFICSFLFFAASAQYRTLIEKDTVRLLATKSQITYDSIAIWAALAGKQATLSLTTTGTGAATLVGATLNIPTPPTYSGTDFIQNQTTLQSSSNFNISGNGTIGGIATAGSLVVSGSKTASAGVAKTINNTGTLVASANSDVLTAVDINPTFTNGSFTGVTNNGLLVRSGNVGIGVVNPAVALEVSGSIRTVGGTAANNAFQMGIAGTGINGTSSVMNFATSNNNRLTIDAVAQKISMGTGADWVAFKGGVFDAPATPTITATGYPSQSQPIYLAKLWSSGIQTGSMFEAQTSGGTLLFNVTPSGGGYFAANVGIGISSPNTTAILDVASTTKGSRPFPSMTAAQRTAITSPAVGLHVYQTDGTEGVYVYKQSANSGAGGWVFAY